MSKIGLPKGYGKRLKVREKSVKSQGISKWILSGSPVNNHRIFKRLAKALIRLHVCAGWSEPLLVTHCWKSHVTAH